jgi:radical SAM superfamily enzyme YgiQ (UPF0313 family)
VLAQETANAIVAFAPDIVGYNCYTANIPTIDHISRDVRLALPGVMQAVGGPHPTIDHETARYLPSIDYVIPGEGEHAVVDLALGRSLLARQRLSDLDTLPFPERTHLWSSAGRPASDDEKLAMDVCALSTARGCPWRCIYCASPSIWTRVYARSPDNILSEIRHVVERHLIPHADANGCLHFVDDTFTYNEKRALAIMAGMTGMGVPWRCEARADTITPRIAEAMAASGCVRVKVGIESGSQRILAAMNKGETIEGIRRGVGILHQHGLAVTGYLMAGFPGETDDDVRQTIDFANELACDAYALSMVVPYYGTALYRDAVRDGIPVDLAPWKWFFHQNDSMLLNHHLSDSLIRELWELDDRTRLA